MARTPLRLQRTTPTSAPLSPINVDVPAGAFGEGIGRALQGVGQSIGSFGAALGQQRDRKRGFQTAIDFSDFTTAMEKDLSELQRNYNPEDGDFVEQAENLYQRGSDNFLNSQVPPELRDEYRLRISKQRGTIVGNSMKFEYSTNDEYFREELNNVFQTSLTNVRNNPDTYDEESTTLDEAIRNSDLSTAEQLRLRQDMRRGLQGARYTGLVVGQGADPSIVWSGDGSIDSYFQKLQTAESGGDPTARAATSTATGLYQFIDSTWQGLIQRYPNAGLTADGRTDPEQQEIAVQLFTAENAQQLQAAGIPTTHANLYAAHFLGAGGARQILAAPNDAMVRDIVSPGTVSANPFLRSMSVADFKAWTEGKVGSGAEIDPRFADLTYAQRNQLYNQANSALQQQATAEQQALEQQQQGLFESQFTSIVNGDPGVSRQSILELNRQGLLNASRTERLLADFAREQGGRAAQGRLDQAIAGGIPVDPANADMRKAADQKLTSTFGSSDDFQQQLFSGDTRATQTAFAISTSSGVVPPMYASGLTSMLNSQQPQAIVGGAVQIHQIAQRQPAAGAQAFKAGTVERAGLIARTAELYGIERANELAARMIDPNMRQSVMQLREIGLELFNNAIANKRSGGRVKPRDFVTIADRAGFSEFSNVAILREAATPPPMLQAQFTTEFRNAWVTAYGFTGDEDIADEYAADGLKRSWGFSEVNGVNTFVKFPVSLAAPGWTQRMIDRNVQQTLNVDEDSRLQLITTGVTENLVLNGQPPVYQAFDLETYDLYTDEAGLPMVVDFATTPQVEMNLMRESEIRQKTVERQVFQDRLDEAVAIRTQQQLQLETRGVTGNQRQIELADDAIVELQDQIEAIDIEIEQIEQLIEMNNGRSE